MNDFTLLQEIGKLLYRYSIFRKNKFLTEAKEEKQNIQNVVLKGKVNYNRYIWHAENSPNTCKECRLLDGTVFKLYDKVPKYIHPNCKCKIEILNDDKIEDTNEKNKNNSTSSDSAQSQSQQSTPSENEQPRNWIMPCNGPIVGQYGETRSTHIHNGIDISVPIGTPIKAIADGTVVVTGPVNGYGYWVGINHGLVNGVKVSSEYGHLSKWVVHNGQKVKQGQVIAYSGNSGYSQGPHLHLTIRHGNPGKGGGIAVNPWIYIGH